VRLFEAPELFIGWKNLLKSLYNGGSKSTPRGLATRELLGVTFHIQHALGNILYHPLRGANYKFMVAEWLWIMSGSDNLEEIAQYNSQLRKFSDDGVSLYGAYGVRLKANNQIQNAIEKLKADPFSRQAVMVIWKQGETPSKDVPCTVAFQLLIRHGKLNGIVTMRSSDIWLGLTYDFFVFSQILNCCAGELEVRPGFLQFNLGSSHMYESDAEKIKGLLDDISSGETLVSQRLTSVPPEILLDVMRQPIYYKSYDTEILANVTPPWLTYVQVLTSPKEDAIKILTA
jgi:thymidylate synthase